MKTFFSYLAAVAALLSLGAKAAEAQSTDHEFGNSGLVTQWESNVGGSPLAQGADSLKFWAHTSDVSEVVKFLANGKLVKTFKSDDIDETLLEETLLSGKSSHETPKLGLEGAIKKAEKLAVLYGKVGRKTEIQKEISRAYYAIAVGDTGIITALDAEKGTTLWRRELPHSALPILGPAVSDNYVAAINGHEFFVYRLKDGNLITRRRLKQVATAKPVLFKDKIAIPSTGGRLIIYDILNYRIEEQVIRVGNENRIGVAKSVDGQFLAWPMKSKLVVTKLEYPPLMWFTADAGNGSDLPSMPVTLKDGFLVVSHNGTVSKFSLDRHNPFQWKTLIGTACNQLPVAGVQNAAVTTQDSRLYLIDLATGDMKWKEPVRGISNALTVTEKHVYALDTAKNLVTIDAESGRVLARVFVGQKIPVPNSSTDRIVFADGLGMVTCLREPQSLEPILVAPFSKELTEEETSKKTGSTDQEEDAAAEETEESTEEIDDFGSEEDMDLSTPDESTESESDDPFAAF